MYVTSQSSVWYYWSKQLRPVFQKYFKTLVKRSCDLLNFDWNEGGSITTSFCFLRFLLHCSRRDAIFPLTKTSRKYDSMIQFSIPRVSHFEQLSFDWDISHSLRILGNLFESISSREYYVRAHEKYRVGVYWTNKSQLTIFYGFGTLENGTVKFRKIFDSLECWKREGKKKKMFCRLSLSTFLCLFSIKTTISDRDYLFVMISSFVHVRFLILPGASV